MATTTPSHLDAVLKGLKLDLEQCLSYDSEIVASLEEKLARASVAKRVSEERLQEFTERFPEII